MARVLVAEDDSDIAMGLRDNLEFEGYEVIVAEDGEAALNAATQQQPDLILLDLMMPEPNGFEVCKMLRADPTYANIPIVIVTAMDDNESKETAYGAGANDYLIKPFRMDALAQAIETLIGQTD